MEAKVKAFIYENSSEGGVVTYTDRSVVHHWHISWAYVVQFGGKTVSEDCVAFALPMSSLTIELMAVTKAIAWLESQTFCQGYFLSDSLNMLMKF